MRKIIVAGILGFGALGPAHAADMLLKAPPPAACDWCGGYVGLNAGGDWGRSSFTPYPGLPFPAFLFTDPLVGLIAVPAEFATLPPVTGHATSIIGGGQAGYNWQSGRFVYGFEGDIDGTGLREKSSSTLSRTIALGAGATQTVTANFSADVGWIATVRGRLGYAADRTLFYVTGGLAVAGTSVSTAYSITEPQPALFPPLPLATSDSRVIGGWTLGGGGEWAIDRTWTVGVEYRHTDLGTHGYNLGFSSATLVGLPGISPTSAAVHFTEDQVTARLNYHLH